MRRTGDQPRNQAPVELTHQYNVPLFINDRIDVFLAVRPAGLHIGQTDMSLQAARALVGDDAVIGVSVGNEEQARIAIAQGADYVGVGAVWDTGSKDVRGKRKLGPAGAGKVLDVLAGSGVQSVAIGESRNAAESRVTHHGTDSLGGIHPPNVPFLLHGAISPVHRVSLDGIAVISAIVGSRAPADAARGLRAQIDSFKRARKAYAAAGLAATRSAFTSPSAPRTAGALVETVAELMDVVRANTPLVHQVSFRTGLKS